jgi:hypothetical protein
VVIPVKIGGRSGRFGAARGGEIRYLDQLVDLISTIEA